MSGLFIVTFWRDGQKIDSKTLFAKSWRGVFSRVTRLFLKLEFAAQVTVVNVYLKDNPSVKFKRYYEDAAPISPWVDIKEPTDAI